MRSDSKYFQLRRLGLEKIHAEGIIESCKRSSIKRKTLSNLLENFDIIKGTAYHRPEGEPRYREVSYDETVRIINIAVGYEPSRR